MLFGGIIGAVMNIFVLIFGFTQCWDGRGGKYCELAKAIYSLGIPKELIDMDGISMVIYIILGAVIAALIYQKKYGQDFNN